MDGSSRITVTVDPAGLSATVRIIAGDAATAAELRAALDEAKVRSGILEATVEELGSGLASAEFTENDRLIAEGVPAMNGRDGELEFLVSVEKTPGHIRKNQSIDFRERGLVTNIAEGAVIARYHAATQGEAGTTVQGAVLDAQPGVETLLELGAGVALEDSGAIRSNRDGVLHHVAGAFLDVTDLCKHDADVDYASGNLHVEGTAWVTGTVHPNFEVTATADTIIDGSVDDGSVQAGANVVVHEAVLGREHGVVRARGDLECHHCNGATLAAGGVLTVGDHCLSTNLLAAHVRLVEGRGRLSGGVTRSRHSIHAQEVGSPGEVQTVLMIGYAAAERAALRKSRIERDKSRRSENKRTDRGKGDRAKGGKSARSWMQLDRAVRTEARRLREIEAELLRDAEIVVSGIAHPGVRIRFAASGEHILLEEQSNVRITVDPETETVHTEGLGG